MTCHSEKQGAAPNFKHGFGYHPLLVWLDNTNEALAGMLSVPLVWHDRRSHHLVTFPAGMHDLSWVDALMSLVRDGPMRAVEIRKINGATLADSPDAGWIRPAAIEAGFTDSYRGLAFRRS